jgi:putative tryptophan/tyrosine transport system substrate-binding protein
VRRRQFLAALAVLGAPALAIAQPSRLRRIGIMLTNAESDRDGHVRVSAFREGMEKLGWFESRNVQFDIRWGAGSPERARIHAAELVAAECDAILANGTPPVAALRQTGTSIPIVFAVVTDPVGAGFVQSLSHPGGNITGFSTFEPAMGGKWMDLLREAAPGLQRIGCILDPGFRGFSAVLQDIENAAPKQGLDVSKLVLREKSDDIAAHVAEFAARSNGGLIVFPTAINDIERRRIFAIAERHHLPAIYPFRHFAVDGGLMAYGFDPPDLFRRSAAYVDRILKGAKPADLPVQAPTRFELVVNVKTARTIGLEIPPTLLARADEVIE